MTCPVCNGETQVTYTYDKEDHVIRDRKCRECNYRFQTIEADEDMRTTTPCKICAKRTVKIKKFIQDIKNKLSELEATND